MITLTRKELLHTPAPELLKRKGFGLKALIECYEELRLTVLAKAEAYGEVIRER